MPSSLPDRDSTGKTRQRNFQPALKALNNLVAELENSVCPEDIVKVKTNALQMKLQSVRLDHDNTKKNHTRNRTVAQSNFQKTQAAFEDIDSKSASDESDDDSLEEVSSKSRALTEMERLQEAQTGLEKKIKETREITKREDRTRNQRKFAEDKLRRLESKLEVLERRLELERTGGSRWTYVRRNVKKPRVGFQSSELLNRSRPSAKFQTSESSSEVSPKLADVITEAKEKRRNAEDVEAKEETTARKRLFESRELEELHLTLKQKEIQERTETEWRGKDEDDEAKDVKEEQNKRGNGDGIQDNRRHEEVDRNELSKGWLRISDRPDEIVKRIEVSESKHSKEAWVNISEPGIAFAKRVFRTQAKVNNGLSLSLGGKRIPLVQSSGTVKQDKNTLKKVERAAVEPQEGQPELAEVGSAIVASSKTSQVKVVTKQNLAITTTFLPPIPVSDAKKRPRKKLLEKVKDEQDVEQRETRVTLIPNRQRVAKRRFLMYIRQLEFSKNHKLDQKEIVSNMADAIKDYSEVEVQEHPKKPTPRKALYLIGALSKNHLRPPTAQSN